MAEPPARPPALGASALPPGGGHLCASGAQECQENNEGQLDQLFRGKIGPVSGLTLSILRVELKYAKSVCTSTVLGVRGFQNPSLERRIVIDRRGET